MSEKMKYTIMINHDASLSEEDKEIMQKIEYDLDKIMEKYQIKKQSQRVNLPDETMFIYEK
jgi:hypothetical protein